MSTYHYLECLDHSPVLCSADEVEQHSGTGTLETVRQMIRDRATLADQFQKEVIGYPAGYFEARAFRFLIQHPHCRIRLINEYGYGEEIFDAPTVPVSDTLRLAVGGVLFNVSNFPEKAQPRLLGQDMRPLTEKITDAILDRFTLTPKETP